MCLTHSGFVVAGLSFDGHDVTGALIPGEDFAFEFELYARVFRLPVAVVQLFGVFNRMTDTASGDLPEDAFDDVSDINQAFGIRFQILYFQWLDTTI